MGTEVITRGLIALRDTRTPLITDSLQLIGRGTLMALLVGTIGVVAIPLAFVISASVETLALGSVLLAKLQRRLGSEAPGMAPAAAGTIP